MQGKQVVFCCIIWQYYEIAKLPSRQSTPIPVEDKDLSHCEVVKKILDGDLGRRTWDSDDLVTCGMNKF